MNNIQIKKHFSKKHRELEEKKQLTKAKLTGNYHAIADINYKIAMEIKGILKEFDNLDR